MRKVVPWLLVATIPIITVVLLFSPFSQLVAVISVAVAVSILILRWPALGAAILIASEWASGFIDYWGLGVLRLNLWLGIGILFLILLRAKVQRRIIRFDLTGFDGILFFWVLINLISLYVNGLNTAFSESLRYLWTGYSLYLIVKWSLSETQDYWLIATIVMLFGFVQIGIGFDTLLSHGVQVGRFRPYGQNPNGIATQIFFSILLLTSIFLASRRYGAMGFFWAIYTLASLAILATTGSRSVLAAAILGIAWSFWSLESRKRLILGLPLVVAVIGLLVYFLWPWLLERAPDAVKRFSFEGYTDPVSVTFHQASNKVAIQGFLNHPIFGIGPGNGIAYFGGYARVHNLYTNVLLELGILGFMSLASIVVYTTKKALKYTNNFLERHEFQKLFMARFIAAALIGHFLIIAIFHGTLLAREYFILFAILESLQVGVTTDVPLSHPYRHAQAVSTK